MRKELLVVKEHIDMGIRGIYSHQKHCGLVKIRKESHLLCYFSSRVVRRVGLVTPCFNDSYGVVGFSPPNALKGLLTWQPSFKWVRSVRY